MYPANLLPLISAFSVFPIWIIEQFIPYPHIIEELAKSLFIANTRSHKNHTPYTLVALSGFSFGISETILYQITNLQNQNDLNLASRIYTVVPMHILTFLIMFFGQSKNKIISFVSVLVSIGIHYSFNNFLK